MNVLIKVQGLTNAPVNFIDCFIDLIEANHWYFGGGMFDGAILGTVYAYRDLTVSEVQETLKAWFRKHGYSLDATFGYIIETEDLQLRQAEFADWKPMYENVWRHESAARYMTWDVTRSEGEARDRIERTIRYQQNGGLSFIVTLDGEPIGFAGVMETAPGIFEDTGGCLGPDFQRKGYGKQMLSALERLVFNLGAEKFIVAHHRDNLPSKKVILSRGFRYTHSEERDDRILDFYEKRRSDLDVKLTYHGHACFTLEYEGKKAVIDPYAWGMVPGQADLHLNANAVYCSHGHADHNFTQAVELNETTPLPWTVTEFETAHDECGGAKRGMNTVRIFDCGGIRVAHLGDLGCFPDEELENALDGIDCMLIPVGGYYTIGTQTAYQIIRSLKPKVAIPMHYRTDKTGFDEISHIDDFCKLWNQVEINEGTFSLTKETANQIVVLK